MRSILLMLIGFTSLSGDWHPWHETPYYGGLYMYQMDVPFMFPYDKEVYIIQPYTSEGAFYHLQDVGWYDVNKKSLEKLIEMKIPFIFLPGRDLPSWMD